MSERERACVHDAHCAMIKRGGNSRKKEVGKRDIARTAVAKIVTRPAFTRAVAVTL